MSVQQTPVSDSRLDHVLKVGLACKAHKCAQTSTVLKKNPLADKCPICQEPIFQKPLTESQLQSELTEQPDRRTRFFRLFDPLNTDQIRPLFVDSNGDMYHLSCAKAYVASGNTTSPLTRQPWTKEEIEELSPPPKEPSYALKPSVLFSLGREGMFMIKQQNMMQSNFRETFESIMQQVTRDNQGEDDFIETLLEAEAYSVLGTYASNIDKRIERYFEEDDRDQIRLMRNTVDKIRQMSYMREYITRDLGDALSPFSDLFINCLYMDVDTLIFRPYMKLASYFDDTVEGTSYENEIEKAVDKYVEYVTKYATERFSDLAQFNEYISRVLRNISEQDAARMLFTGA